MAAGIYKLGQGYYTRWVSAIAYGLLVAMGALWLWNVLKTVQIGEIEQIYISGVGALIFSAVGGFLIYFFIGRHRKVVDFMIATEGEMKKVNWSTRREILGSTWIVIIVTFLIAILIFLLDIGYTWFFTQINVLES